jgi:mediator of RNA polymerase II transcription subunit 14
VQFCAVSQRAFGSYSSCGSLRPVCSCSLPSQADHDRKRHIFQYALTTRKGFVKLYVAAKWAENARAVQTCLDIMQYCNRAGEQLQHASAHLATIANALGSLRLRNADLLTALDVLSTGTYRRLPKVTTELYTPQPPMSREDVVRVMRTTDAAIRLRLRTQELLPADMSSYRVGELTVELSALNA